MAKVLILGGYGHSGRALARHLRARSDAKLVLAGRRLHKAEAEAREINKAYGGDQVSAMRVDAADEEGLRKALETVSMLVVAAPTTQHAPEVISGALDSGVDYLDIQLDLKKLNLLKSLEKEIAASERCFITEAGFHPGLPSAMVRLAADQFDQLQSVSLGCYLNMGPTLPYSEGVDELMQVFRNYRAQVFENGAWTKPSSYRMRQMEFGGEIGRRRCFSLFFEELRAMPQQIPTLENLAFYMAETHWLVDWIITPLIFMGLRLAPQRSMRSLGRLMWWGMQTFPKPPYLVALKMEAHGEKAGRPMRMEVTLSHADGYELTAIPVVACLLQYFDGSARRPGLWMMGHLVDPVRLLKDMEHMGVEVIRETTQGPSFPAASNCS
jgi:saccharopine dehydrogenase (NAD+, L-lysine-forming)